MRKATENSTQGKEQDIPNAGKGARSAAFWANVIAFLALVSSTGIGLWGFHHPENSPQNNFQMAYNFVSNKIFNIGTGSVDVAVSGSASQPPASSPSGVVDPPQDFVALRPLAQQPIIELSRAQSARLEPGRNTQVHLLIRVTSTKSAWKVFAPYGLPGWSLTTESGGQCSIDYNLNGILMFGSNGYQDHIPEMQTVSPGTELNSNITANCNRPVQVNDKLYLSAQLYTLPATATPGSPNSENPTIQNFNSDPIPVN